MKQPQSSVIPADALIDTLTDTLTDTHSQTDR